MDPDETLRPEGSVEASRGLDVGTRVAGRYQILRFIANGAMGEVYAAHDLVLDAHVALKTLRADLEGSSTAVERLRREITLARKVTNEHVCRLHDVGEHAGRVFLTMELLDGRTLAEEIKQRGPLPIDEVERFARQLVDGLAALHRAGIVHRDFKPGNVIVVGERAVITDFGLARSMRSEGDSALTEDSRLVGTPAYMAPEQVEGRVATPASDIYALGIVLFELLTGSVPFRKDTPMATAIARLQDDPARPSSLRREIPARWDAIVSRCLARAPADRFATVDAVLDEPAPKTRRWFLAAGGAAIAAAGIGAWRVLRAPSTRFTGIAAVLPISGFVKEPLRLAMTVDLFDALGTAGVPVLALDGGGFASSIDGTATLVDAKTARDVPGVTAVVQLEMHDGALDVILDGERRTFQHANPALLVMDVAAALARDFDARPPRVPRDAPGFDRARYIQYGEALLHLFHDEQNGDAALASLVEGGQLGRVAARLVERIVDEAQWETDALPKLRRAEPIIERALAADPEVALVHAARARAQMLQWKWGAATADSARAVELAPADALALGTRAFVITPQGMFDEAAAISERVFARNPRARTAQHRVVASLFIFRRFNEAIRIAEPIVARNGVEKVAGIAASLANAYNSLARHAEALAIADKLRGMKTPAASSLIPIYMTAGKPEIAQELYAQAEASASPGDRALMLDMLGRSEEAIAQLEKAVDAHGWDALFLKVDPYSNALRAMPRFRALVARVGLT